MVILLFVLLLFSSEADAARLQTSDITYVGAFRLPDAADVTVAGTAQLSQGGGTELAWNPDNGTLFISGHQLLPGDVIGEFTPPATPTASLSTVYGSLAQASIVQDFAEINATPWATYGCGQCFINGMGYIKISGKATKVCWTRQNWYNVTGTDEDSLGCNDADLSNPHSIWHPGLRTDANFHSNMTGGYMFQIPSSVASRWGNAANTVCVGFARFGGAFGGSTGPVIDCFDLWQGGTSLPTDDTDSNLEDGYEFTGGFNALRYPGFGAPPYCWEQTPNTCAFPDYQAPDQWNGGAYISNGTREAVIIAGSKCVAGDSWYKTGVGYRCGHEPAEDGEFQHWLLFYDVDELADVAQGKRNPETVVPYATLQVPNFTWFTPSNDHFNMWGSLGYDESTRQLYISHAYTGPNAQPVFQVMQVAAGDASTAVTLRRRMQ